jgi:hypothetical protein
MKCVIDIFGEGDNRHCSIAYEHDEVVWADKTTARNEAAMKAQEAFQLLFGYPELQQKASELYSLICNTDRYPM